MYELFELVRLLSVRRQSTRQGPVELTRFAWRENGESSLLALLCSNGETQISTWYIFKEKKKNPLDEKMERGGGFKEGLAIGPGLQGQCLTFCCVQRPLCR